MLSYKATVDTIFETGQQSFENPHIPVSVKGLQHLADVICDMVTWVSPVQVHLLDSPEDCGIFEVEFALRRDFKINSVPQAMIAMTIDLDAPIVHDISQVYFFDRRFLSVGTLLHELAHLHPPFNNHGERFKMAHIELVKKWDVLFKWKMGRFVDSSILF